MLVSVQDNCAYFNSVLSLFLFGYFKYPFSLSDSCEGVEGRI